MLAVFFVAVNKSKDKKVNTDYRAFFFMGVTWFLVGLATDIIPLFVLGLVYMVVGLVNRERWNETTKDEKRERITMGILGFALLLTVLAVLITLVIRVYF